MIEMAMFRYNGKSFRVVGLSDGDASGAFIKLNLAQIETESIPERHLHKFPPLSLDDRTFFVASHVYVAPNVFTLVPTINVK